MWASLGLQMVKHQPAMVRPRFESLSQEDLLKNGNIQPPTPGFCPGGPHEQIFYGLQELDITE